MKTILFATGNKNKIKEAMAILPAHLESFSADLPEIQSMDSSEIIAVKLKAAYQQCRRPVIAEDVSVELEALHGFPGPFVKFVETALGEGGLHVLLQGHANKRATAIATIGYTEDGEQIRIFTGKITGTIVAPRGSEGWGFDKVFVPDSYTQTNAELGMAIKNTISHRYLALQELAKFLKAH
jgi:non-canonical purine NTP pyrophosphatase (RdgB/HAM1 family)